MRDMIALMVIVFLLSIAYWSMNDLNSCRQEVAELKAALENCQNR